MGGNANPGDGTGWPRVGVYLSSSATRRGLGAADLAGVTAESTVVYESANVIDDVVTGAREPGPSDDGVLALLRELAELTGGPVTSTLMGLGAFPASSEQWLGMLGMHGTYEANLAMQIGRAHV